MSKQNDGGPAYPLGMDTNGRCDGMSLRDYFAGQALAGMLAYGGRPSDFGERAATCYALADAMLAERNKNDDT